MTCQLAECVCVGPHFALRIFCDHWRVDETPFGDLDLASIRNWARIHPAIRERCVGHLRREMFEYPEVVAHWREQSRRNMRIGSDKVRFHFDEGMQIRNILRRIVPDSELPSVTQPDGKSAQNWDDFYRGALEALVSGHTP